MGPQQKLFDINDKCLIQFSFLERYVEIGVSTTEDCWRNGSGSGFTLQLFSGLYVTRTEHCFATDRDILKGHVSEDIYVIISYFY